MSADARAGAAATLTAAMLTRWNCRVHPPAAVDIYLDVLARLDQAAMADERDYALIDYGHHESMRVPAGGSAP